MKYKSKLVLSTIITIFLVLLLKSVSAVNDVYQGIYVYDDINRQYMMYITVVKPHSSTLNDFQNYNTWYRGEDISQTEPAWNTYKTNYLIFTKNMIGSYESSSSDTGVGYTSFSLNIKGYLSLNNIAEWIKFVKENNNHIKNVIVTDNPEVFGNTPLYTYGYDENGVPIVTDSNLSSDVFEKYNNNTINTIGEPMKISPLLSADYTIESGRKWVKPVAIDGQYLRGVVKLWQEYTMLYTEDTSLSDLTPSSTHDTSKIYYITVVKLTTEITNELRKYKMENLDKDIYVSGISETMNRYSNPTKFYMLTPGAWLYSKLRKFNGIDGWSRGTLGASSTDGLQSGLNLWDNQLYVPLDVEQDKKIIVNHIAVNVDSEGKKTFEIIDTEEETLTAKNENDSKYNKIDTLYLNSNKTLTTSQTSEKMLNSKNVLGNGMTQYIIKAPANTTEYQVNQLTNLETGYVYKGYFIDPDTKMEDIPELYISDMSKKYDVKKTGDAHFNIASNKTEVIVNLYYEVETKTVTVSNKVCADTVNYTDCVEIEGNKSITITYGDNSRTLKWTKSALKEEYYVNKYYTVTAHMVENDSYKYMGYKLIEGTKEASGKEDECTSKTRNNITIEFYYERKTEIKKIFAAKPTIDIPGTLTVQSVVGVSTTCKDYYSVPTNAKNGENDVYVGIKNTPTYILAGINVEQQEVDDQKVTIEIKISFGPNEKKWTIEVPYSMSYYAIQDLLIYKYQSATIFNSGQTNTKGDTLFENNMLAITPKNESTLTLNAIVNNNISYTDMNNWKNYLVTSFKTNYAVPTDNPEDSVENSTDRKNKSFELYLGYGYNTLMYYSPYEEVNNAVNKYITTELAEQYRNIKLTGSATISIELLSEEKFNVIDKDGNKELNLTDLQKFADKTDEEEEDFEEAKTALGNAESNYRSTCSDYGYSFPCASAVKAKYNAEKKNCTSQVKEVIPGSCDDEGNCSEDKVTYKSCSDCAGCSSWKARSTNANTLDSKWKNAKTKYNNALTNLKNAYKAEVDAIAEYDEAYYIQENLWKVYKQMDKEDIAKLLGLNVKFDYSSGNAKLENTDLMTVKKHTLELVSDSTNALSGQLVEDDCKEQELVASRQTLTDAQKKYYTEGIASASWLQDVSSIYYNNNAYTIPITRLNGTRVLAGEAEYKIDTVNKVGTSTVVQDNMYYDVKTNEDKNVNTVTETVFDVNSSSSFSKSYGVSQKNSEEFNVYTPLVVTAEVSQDIDIIDQTATNKYSGKDVIQSNSTFTINFSNGKDKVYNSNLGDFTSRYKQVTYIKFKFAVTNVKYTGANGMDNSYGSKDADEWIGPIYGDYITAVPYLNTTQGESVTDETYEYYIIAAAVNTKESWTKQLLAYINTSLNDLKNSNLVNTLENACGYEGKDKLSYYADYEGEMVIVNRVYDFRVTDLKDIDWKDVFRNNTSASYVNQHSGIAYYAGLTKWNTKNPTVYNQIVGRTTDEIGTSPTRILPLGPYKNTNTSYISAPKLGYRFSFDLKVTGAMDNNKYVKIEPSFYYISKDGKIFYTEYSSGNEGIYLFYKNSNGKYVRVGSSSDTYKIQFTPNDGYRSLVQTDVKNLNSNVVTLGGLKKLVLKFSETTTTSRNDAAITYYGEYKLPNSTIAVYVDKNGKYDINNPLTDGYIGVVFDIQAYETEGVSLTYGKNSYKGLTNTSQWDYEGYLGISKLGSDYSTTMKLEKGIWRIDNDTYNEIKGTVILYDTDSKASNDFN